MCTEMSPPGPRLLPSSNDNFSSRSPHHTDGTQESGFEAGGEIWGRRDEPKGMGGGPSLRIKPEGRGFKESLQSLPGVPCSLRNPADASQPHLRGLRHKRQAGCFAGRARKKAAGPDKSLVGGRVSWRLPGGVDKPQLCRDGAAWGGGLLGTPETYVKYPGQGEAAEVPSGGQALRTHGGARRRERYSFQPLPNPE